ncbi:MAG: GAF domain-containing protein [Bryobacteraceae bacterium]
MDDDPASLTALQAVLEGPGQEVVLARSGRDALSRLLEEDFAAIILDVKMPDLDGFETAELIRQRKRSKFTPILFLTGYMSDAHLFRGYDLGGVDFLSKPVIPEVLRSKVSAFVELNRLNQELERQVRERAQEQQATERELTLLIKTCETLLNTPKVQGVLEAILSLAQQFVHADAYAVWRTHGENWRAEFSAGLSKAYPRTTPGTMDKIDFGTGEIEDVFEHPGLKHRVEAYRAEGIRSMLVVTMRLNNEPIGTVVFYYRTPHKFTASEKRLASVIGNLASSALASAEMFERELASRTEAEAAEARANFLVRAGAVLSSSLDYKATLESLAELAVPFLADWCAVDIVAESGEVERLAVKHLDPAKIELVREAGARYPPGQDSTIRTALKTGKSLLIETIDDALLAARSRDADHLKLIRSLGLRSAILAPLVARGRTLGVLTFAMAESGRHHTAQDRHFAEELAGRAAVAVDNARLHRDAVQGEEQIRTLADSLPQLAWMARPDGHIFWYNRGWYAYTGTTPEQMEGWGWETVHDPAMLPSMIEKWKESLRTGMPFDMEFPLRAADGSYGWFLTRAILLRDGSGRPQLWIGTNTDITAMKRAEEERATLLAREQEARSTAELLNRVGPTLLEQVEMNKLVQSVTDMATALTGAEFGAFFYNVPDEDRGLHMLYAISGAPREAFSKFPMPRNTDVFEPRFNVEGMVRSDDITQDPRYGKNAPYYGMPEGHLPVKSYLAAPVVSRSGEMLGGLFFSHSIPGKFNERHEAIVIGLAAQGAIAMDNARLFEQEQWAQQELRRSNEDLRRANKDLETFAYSASHDLQEPLRNIAIYGQLLQRSLGSQLDAETARFLEGILDGAIRMENLVKDLLSYTRAAKPAESAPMIVEAGAVLARVLQNLKLRIEQTSATIHAGELPGVAMHEMHLSQLLQNLIGNALKYRGKEAPVVHVSAIRKDGWCIFSVADNGIGIDLKYRTQIFGLFKRLHSRDYYPGNGVGLAICHRIVEQYGGRIWLEKSTPGHGSVFSFSVPDQRLQ